MNRLKISFQNILILSAVGISFICAPSDPQRLNACNVAMAAAFGEYASPLDCVKKAIKSFILEKDLISLHDDVKVYYGTFASKIDLTSVVMPPKYCADTADGNITIEKDCNMSLKYVGLYSPILVEYQLSLVYGVLFGIKQIEKEEIQAYKNNQILNVCAKGSYRYNYLGYTADHIRLLTRDPSVCWKADRALRMHGKLQDSDSPRRNRLNACNTAMTATFGRNVSPIACVQKAIRSFILGPDLVTLHRDVGIYYGTFASKIDFRSIVTPPVYCYNETKDLAFGNIQAELDCNDALKLFGEYSENETEYRIKLLTGILLVFKKIELSELDQYAANGIYTVCVNGSYGYDYLEYTARHIQLIQDNPPNSIVEYLAIHHFGQPPNPDDPRPRQLYSTYMRSPSLFCDYQYGPESI